MSDAKGGHPPDSEVWRKLSNEGPQPIDRRINYRVRQDGVQKFKPSSSPVGSSMQGGGHSTVIYYIDGKHSPKAVIQAWLNHNQNVVDGVTTKALHWRIAEYGDDWKEASRELLGPIGNKDSNHGNGVSPGTCPACGDDYDMNLPHHFRHGCDSI